MAKDSNNSSIHNDLIKTCGSEINELKRQYKKELQELFGDNADAVEKWLDEIAAFVDEVDREENRRAEMLNILKNSKKRDELP